MKKIIVLTSVIAATATTVASVAIAKKVKANKIAEIEAAMDAANAEPITEESDEEFEPEDTSETVDLFNNYSKDEEHETYESEPIPVTDESELEMCEKCKAEEEAKSEASEEVEEDDSEVYNWTVQYCPRLEDGEKCKTEHDTKLEFLGGENTNVFTKISHKNHYNWDEHQEVINAIKEFFEYQFKQEFKVDFVGYELFTRPFIMGHVGNDPRNSILCRPYPIKEFTF